MTFMMIQNVFFHYLSVAPTMVLIDNGANPISLSADPGAFVNKFTSVGVALAVVVAVILISIAGYKMLSSRGDSTAIKDAQDQIQNAIMGFILIIAAVAVVRIIFTALGIADLVGL